MISEPEAVITSKTKQPTGHLLTTRRMGGAGKATTNLNEEH
jgi:hypothetical protein